MYILIGVIIGMVIASLFFLNPRTTFGVLRVDHSNPEKDVYRFEIDDLDRLRTKKKVILTIDHHADLSQK